MSHRICRLLTIPALAGTVLAPMQAAADVTPDAVWDGFRAYLETAGYSVEATRAERGGDVVIEDLTATMEMSEDDAQGTLVFEAESITFEDQGDGTVRILFPQSMPITITTDDSDQPETVVRLDYVHTGLSILASGDAQDQRYDLEAQSLGIELDEIVVNGEALPAEMGSGSFTLATLSGTMSLNYGDLLAVAQNLQAESLSYAISFTDPDTGDTGSLTGALSDVAMEGAGTLPDMDPGLSADAMVAAGLTAEGSFTYGAGQSQFSGTSEGAPVEGTSSSSSGNFSVTLSPEGLRYGAGAENIEMSATVPDLPFPLSASIERLQTNVALPVTASEEPQDFSLLVELAGLEVAQMIWMMFDPTEILPRDPATLLIDVTGQATSFLSILDPEAMAAAGTPPGEVNAVSINALRLDAAGAELTANGAFTFDNEDLQTFEGMPAPAGEATMTLSGANALIDRLIQMGLLSNEDAMGARMMISMFSVPGEAPDTLTSTVTVTEEGQVLANGQRLR